jgi:hypothetical protein
MTGRLITHLRHVDLAVPDHARQLEFYTHTWGLTPEHSDTGLAFLAAEGSPEQQQGALDDRDRAQVSGTVVDTACIAAPRSQRWGEGPGGAGRGRVPGRRARADGRRPAGSGAGSTGVRFVLRFADPLLDGPRPVALLGTY